MAIGPSLMANSLATFDQLSVSASNVDGVPVALEDSVRYEATRLLQCAAVLLRMPQDIAAQAIVLMCRFWTGADGASMLRYNAKDVAAAALYIAVKPSGHSLYPRLLLTIFDYLAGLSPDYTRALDADAPAWTFTEGKYEQDRSTLYQIEGHMLRILGFQTHVAIPHALCITYLQALDVFNTGEGPLIARRAVELLNTGLFSPQLLYLTYQPNVLAVSAIYLAARQVAVKLPEAQWWEIFDVDREDLGFVVVGLQSVARFVEQEKRPSGQGLLTVDSVRQAMKLLDGDATAG